ncbi:nucleotidyltransferase-like protein [Bacillus sp. es.036]|uniref:nucleotidyltransferase-like protein n=1 Tax=Bacillus sp. es.036 TaxID=1761764 RepID=UPI000BF6770B|nr:nucleotidyltransferase-like protein [Bacillus sp. es.036]PFG03021.1 nucleotidyltransferase-like protein [Bacillus sp. es.036]
MENLLRPIYQERASHPGTLGVLVIEKTKPFHPLTDNFDVVLLIIVQDNEKPWFVKHYDFEGKKAAMHVVSEEQVNEWLISGSHRRLVAWLVNGKIIFDRNEYIAGVKERIRDFPYEERTRKIGVEFARLIRRYTEGKELFASRQYMDAYNFILHALHHLARLSVIEHGFHPEITVWNQVKHIEPEIFKLYTELLSGEDPLDKRLELLLLANDFSLSSKSKNATVHIRKVMNERSNAWTYQELMEEEQLKEYGIDLGALLEYMIEKGLVEVHRSETKGSGIFIREYSAIE